MNNQMDKLLKMTLQSQVEPEKALEQKTIQRMEAMSDNKRRNVKKVKRRVRHSFRPVLAGLGVLLLVGIITGGYAVADETNIARVLYAGIWGEPETQKEVKRVRSEMEIVSENSTFEDISIKPVEAVTDGMVSYVLIKVEGKNGFELADDMGFDRMGMALLDEKKKNVMTYDSYLLKKEKNVMYIAIYMQANGRNISEMESIKIFAHDFHYVVYGEEGRVEDVKHLDVEKHLDGGSRVGYTEKSIAARGDYEAEIKCSILEERLEICSGSYEFFISSLGVVVESAGGIADEVNGWDIPEENEDLRIVMNDGTEVRAIYRNVVSPEENYGVYREIFLVNEPIDVSKVKGVRVAGSVYER